MTLTGLQHRSHLKAVSEKKQCENMNILRYNFRSSKAVTRVMFWRRPHKR
jgi:hypothetical protein